MLGDMLVTLENAVKAASDGDVPSSLAMLSDDELLASTARFGAVLAAAQVVVAAHAAEVAVRSARERGAAGLARREGYRSPGGLVAARLRSHGAAAHRLATVGAALAPRLGLGGEVLPPRFPHLARRVSRGEVGTDTAALVVSRLGAVERRIHPTAWAEAEERLAELAVGRTPDALDAALNTWIAAIDPDGAAPREDENREKRFLALGEARSRDGLVPLRGLLDTETAEVVRTAFDALTHPRNTDTAPDAAPTTQQSLPDSSDAPQAPAGPTDAEVAAAARGADGRTRGQRTVDALREICSRAMAQGLPDSGGTPTQLGVLIDWQALLDHRGVGQLLGGTTPATARTVRRLACQAEVYPMALAPGGVVLDLGRARRTFSRAQRIALIARDGGCVYPGCDRPPDWCDAHHVRHWADGGATDLDNGVLLCAFHHHLIHDGGHGVIEMRPTAFGPAVPFIKLPRWIDPTQTWHRARNVRAVWSVPRTGGTVG